MSTHAAGGALDAEGGVSGVGGVVGGGSRAGSGSGAGGDGKGACGGSGVMDGCCVASRRVELERSRLEGGNGGGAGILNCPSSCSGAGTGVGVCTRRQSWVSKLIRRVSTSGLSTDGTTGVAATTGVSAIMADKSEGMDVRPV